MVEILVAVTIIVVALVFLLCGLLCLLVFWVFFVGFVNKRFLGFNRLMVSVFSGCFSVGVYSLKTAIMLLATTAVRARKVSEYPPSRNLFVKCQSLVVGLLMAAAL